MTRTVMAVVAALLFQVAPDGEILESRPVELPVLAQAAGIRPYATPPEYEATRSDSSMQTVRIVYSSGGLPVVAYVFVPREHPHPLPAVVFNRGGYVQPEIAHQMAPMALRLVRAGFVVIAPMLRGSAGAPGKDEMGGADLDDLLAVQPLVAGLPYVDADNLFLYGESRGGVMSLMASARGFRARAVATVGAFTSLDTLMADRPDIYTPVIPVIWPLWAQQRGRIVESRSALMWPAQIAAPVLLMHGGADTDVNPSQTLALASALQELGKPYELHVFADDNHVLTAHRVERDRMAVAWFNRFLAPTADRPTP